MAAVSFIELLKNMKLVPSTARSTGTTHTGGGLTAGTTGPLGIKPVIPTPMAPTPIVQQPGGITRDVVGPGGGGGVTPNQIGPSRSPVEPNIQGPGGGGPIPIPVSPVDGSLTAPPVAVKLDQSKAVPFTRSNITGTALDQSKVPINGQGAIPDKALFQAFLQQMLTAGGNR